MKSERPWLLSNSIASNPFLASLAVRITVTPNSANLFATANPIPLFAPVTIAFVSFPHHLLHQIFLIN